MIVFGLSSSSLQFLWPYVMQRFEANAVSAVLQSCITSDVRWEKSRLYYPLIQILVLDQPISFYLLGTELLSDKTITIIFSLVTLCYYMMMSLRKGNCINKKLNCLQTTNVNLLSQHRALQQTSRRASLGTSARTGKAVMYSYDFSSLSQVYVQGVLSTSHYNMNVGLCLPCQPVPRE